jgi:DNA polymerase alpha subunit A
VFSRYFALGYKMHWFLTLNQEEDPDIFIEVTEGAYRGVVKGRLQHDDFVVDDGAEGYVDNGMDNWEVGYDNHEESEDEDDRRKCAAN